MILRFSPSGSTRIKFRSVERREPNSNPKSHSGSRLRHGRGIENPVWPFDVTDDTERPSWFTTLDGHCHRWWRQFHRLSLSAVIIWPTETDFGLIWPKIDRHYLGTDDASFWMMFYMYVTSPDRQTEAIATWRQAQRTCSEPVSGCCHIANLMARSQYQNIAGVWYREYNSDINEIFDVDWDERVITIGRCSCCCWWCRPWYCRQHQLLHDHLMHLSVLYHQHLVHIYINTHTHACIVLL